MSDDTTYVVWYDETKQPVATKIQEAVANYRRRFPAATGPVWVLVHRSEVLGVEVEGVTVEAGPYVQVNTYWVRAERTWPSCPSLRLSKVFTSNVSI